MNDVVFQVFQLDSQYVAGSGQSVVDDNKSYVFLLYSPQPASANTAASTPASTSSATAAAAAAAAAAEDSLLIARYCCIF